MQLRAGSKSEKVTNLGNFNFWPIRGLEIWKKLEHCIVLVDTVGMLIYIVRSPFNSWQGTVVFIVVKKNLRKCTKQIYFCQCHGSMLKTESHASTFFHSRAVKCGSCQLTCISKILVQVCTCSHVRACHICRLFNCITTVWGEELWGVWFCSFGNFFTLTFFFFVLFCFLFFVMRKISFLVLY